MHYALTFVYDDGDNATYLHATYASVLKEKQASVEDLMEQYGEMGYLTKVEQDYDDDTIILWTELEDNIPHHVRIVISRIYE